MTKRINRIFYLFLLVSSILFAACNSNVVFTGSVAMKGNKWELMNIPVFKVSVTDTINSNNLSFILRTGSDYPFRNIFLFVTATSPEGKILTDTLQYYLADDKGKWYGRGFGDIHEMNLPYISNVFFPSKGEYTFRIQHGMRTVNLPGIYDIGFRIESVRK
ncbi:MAG TPA: gliding motility lipoprotein GldH [Bacteroidales bacterium]|nr:gliding motility lipoprotein GldH [Bacteroidales bacterium]